MKQVKASGSNLQVEFAKELQDILDDDLSLAEEFYATKDYPKDDIKALKEWIKNQIDDCFGESKAVNNFIKSQLTIDGVVSILKAPKGL